MQSGPDQEETRGRSGSSAARDVCGGLGYTPSSGRRLWNEAAGMGTAKVERELAAILAADVAGYSRLMGANEEGTHVSFMAHLRELIEPKVRYRAAGW